MTDNDSNQKKDSKPTDQDKSSTKSTVPETKPEPIKSDRIAEQDNRKAKGKMLSE